jgi:MFS family permease
VTTAFREGAPHVARGALLLSAALTVITVSVLAPAMPVLKAAFRDEVDVDLWVRLLVTSPALFIALTAPVAGRLADRIGHHRVLAASLALYGAAGSSALVVEGRWPLLLGRALLGVAASGALIASSAIAAARYDAGERARFFAQQAGVMSLAGIAVVSVGGLLGTQHWRAPCLVYLLAFPLLIVVVNDGVALPHAARLASATRLTGASAAWPCALALVGMSFVFMVPLQMPFVLSDAGSPPSIAGLAIALCGAFSAASAFFLGRFVSVSSASDALVWIARSFAVMGSGYVALGLSDGMTAMLAALAVAGIGSGWLMPSLVQWVVSASPEHTRAASLGALTSCVYAGQFASPWLSQLIGAGHSIGFSFTSAGVALFLLAAALVARARLQRA